MKFWGRQVVSCRTATCEAEVTSEPSEAPCVHVWACVYVLLSLPHAPTPRCHCHFSAHPLQCRGSFSIGIVGGWFLLSVYFLCVLYSQQNEDVFCTSCYLSMHSCLSCFLREALVPGEFASGDFVGSSGPMSPRQMLWAGDATLSSAPSAILCWTQLIFKVLLMWKLWRN